ncbi:hypothetical protein UFOVP655_51 [uncultured Caudovirales phage]|uniref:Uncharacterized protein n=1 Tax=uncultured Caudovirales phage TaxID=2100421 RepID=A0A6J5NEX1_9CAUD|nr:hypothetical protein UFOVP655_51 [uncultured Caudovirales phage]
MEKTIEIQLKEQRETIALQIEEMNFGFPDDATSEGKLAIYEFLRIVADHIRGLGDNLEGTVEEMIEASIEIESDAVLEVGVE